MGGKACLTNAELELTQRIQIHFPRGVIPAGILEQWNGCPKEVLTRRLKEFFGRSPNVFLNLISGGESIVIGATDGKEILANANEVFAYIDGEFRNPRTDEPGHPTGEALVEVYEVIKDATFEQMLGSLGADRRILASVRKLCFTQAQIKSFVKDKKHRNWLRADGYGTFFLFESFSFFFVACVFVNSGGFLRVFVYRLVNSAIWDADDQHRLVVPQLA